MAVSDIMTRTLVTVKMDDTLQVVKAIFDRVKFHHLLVVEQGKLCGVISDRDLFKALSPKLGTAAQTDKDLACLHKRVHQIMSRKPVTVAPRASVMTAVRLFNRHKVSCLPVVDNDFRAVGIVSWRDVLRMIEQKQSKKPVGQEQC